MMLRGDIHYIMEGKTTGSEQHAGRPAIIVSNDKCNAHSPVVEVVFLTTSPKTDLPTHVTIRSTSRTSIALCEQITSVSTERLGDYVTTCSEQEMSVIDSALLVSLALNPKPVPSKSKETEVSSERKLIEEDLRAQLKTAVIEREMYKTMYDKLIENILDRRA
jgi:mRNA interferase MazF